MMRWITANQVFDGRKLLRDHAVGIEGETVAAIVPLGELSTDAQVENVGHVLTPGFIDIQVNGGGGTLFNQSPTGDGARRIAATHRALGTTRLVPTVITDRLQVMENAARAIEETVGQNGIVGVHIEGPHIAQARKGTHDPQHIRPFDQDTFRIVKRLRENDVTVLLTLAPEAVAPGDVARLTDIGVLVSIGHTDATLAQVRALQAEGATLFTHLFNAMSQMESRAPGVVGAAISSDAWCSAIFDGHHVADEMLRIACAARPRPDRMIIVSDAMPTVGGPVSFTLYRKTITVRDGKLVNDERSLAGTHVTMAQSVGHAVHRIGLPLEMAIRIAVTHPAEALPQSDLAHLKGLPASDLVLPDTSLARAAAIT